MSPCLEGCATAAEMAGANHPNIAIIVEDALMRGATPKIGIQGMSDSGRQLFASSHLSEKNGGTSAYGVTRVPRWVRVTWREGVDEAHGLYWTSGSIVGDYTVSVLARIPAQVFDRVLAKPGRALRLRFRIKDDGVEIGWAIQQYGKANYFDIQRGGDFVDSNEYPLVEQP